MATTTSTRGRARVVDPAAQPAPDGGRRVLPEGWLRGLISGVEAAVLSWLVVVVPAVAAYGATAAAPALGDASWQGAARTGTAVWLLAHGGELAVSGDEGSEGLISVVPLGLTLLSVLVVYAATRRARIAHHGVAGFVAAGFVLSTLGASFLAPGGRSGALLGAAAVALAGAALATWRSGAPAPVWLAGRLPAWVGDGLRGGGWAVLGLAAVGSGLLAAGLVAGWDRVAMIQDGYLLDPFDLAVMSLAQAVLVPTLGVWAVSWSAGPGFAVGSGTHFAPGEAVTAPLPAIPLLGALPSPEAPGPTWVLLLPVLVGVGAGILLHRRRERGLLEALGAAGVAAAVVALSWSALTLLASGSLGPGRMSEVGAEPPLVAGLLLAETGGALLLTVLVLHPRTAAAATSWTAAAWGSAKGALARLRSGS